MKMELDHEKQDVSLGEIMYEYVRENDYAITQAEPLRLSSRDASTESRGPTARLVGLSFHILKTVLALFQILEYYYAQFQILKYE
jgi:hypothetical protein